MTSVDEENWTLLLAAKHQVVMETECGQMQSYSETNNTATDIVEIKH